MKPSLTDAVAKQIEKNAAVFVDKLFDSYSKKSYAMKKLQKIIDEANDAYRNTENTKLSDKAYDVLEQELKKRTGKSLPVGAPVPNTDERKTRLPFYMGSMNKIKNTDTRQLDSWLKAHPVIGSGRPSYIATDKLDGNSAMLHYVKGGQPPSLYTRGDGMVGQNISHLIPMLKTKIPKFFLEHVAVRGELIMSKKAFKKIETRAANSRNAVAGMVNSKDVDAEIASLTEFVAYELVYPGPLPIEEQLRFIKDELGLQTVTARSWKTKPTIQTLVDYFTERKSKSIFDVDGVVVQHNAKYARQKDQNPSFAFAFKDMDALPSVEARVTGVEWTLSKDGLLKPVVLIEPVQLSGVRIARATGFNGDFILKNKVGPGARVVVVRSGEVIPYISSVVKSADSGVAQMPTDPYEWNATRKEIVLKLEEAGKSMQNALQCKQVENFLSKLGAKGIGAGNVKLLCENGFDTIAKVIRVKATDLVGLPKVGQAKAKIISDGIADALNRAGCVELMEASNAFGSGFGSRKLKSITDGLGREKTRLLLTGKYEPTIKELSGIPGIAEKTAANFNVGLLGFRRFMSDAGIHTCAGGEAVHHSTNNALKDYVVENFGGKKVVFSGVRNKEIEKLITDAGGSVSTSISKNTDVLVASERRGKYLKAVEINEQLGFERIRLVDWEEVVNRLKLVPARIPS